MSRVVSIHQPNYLPWLGLLSKIKNSDVFVVLDDVQYEKGSVTNRNVLLSKNGEQRLTVPVMLSRGHDQKINELDINYQEKWQRKHLLTIRNTYQRSPFFDEVYSLVEPLISRRYSCLSELNTDIICSFCKYLSLNTEIIISSSMESISSSKSLRNAEIVKQLGGGTYLSGLGAKAYNNEADFSELGIKLAYASYVPVEYEHLNSKIFLPNLSALDALFSVGRAARSLI